MEVCAQGLGGRQQVVKGRPIQSSSFYSTTFFTNMEHKTWMCLICGWIYDEALGDPEHGIPAGTKWEDVPMNWTCPECAARKEDFEMVAI
jgi:rubredoxin